MAKIDPLRFQQVVRNVLANAIKFSPACSRIEVDAYAEAAGTLELNIRDHGPGIPASELEKIFDAFVQSSLTKDGSGGTGLGLAISRKIMAAQGGQIWATNMADGGSNRVKPSSSSSGLRTPRAANSRASSGCTPDCSSA